MQIRCEKCSHQIAYEDSVPKFCSECGAALSESRPSTNTSSRDDQTVAASSTGQDLDPVANTISPDNTRPIGVEHVEKFSLEMVGPYRLLNKLGQGGMGTVYEAVNMETGRHVALKLLSPSVRGTEEMVQRFQRESEIAASINHPRSTFVYESGEHAGQLYITMELMDGGTLRDIVEKEGPLSVARAVDYVLDIIDGLLVAHDAGIVHRDLKPSNSFIDKDGRIKVGDFGLAKSFLADSSLTQTGTFMGTPQYAAPEQIRNDDVDERTDIYALGGTLFYLLTGRAPFVGNAAQVISSIATDIPSKVSDCAKSVPKPLVKLIAQTLEKDPNRRPFNLNVVRDELLPFSTRGSMTADPGRRLAAFFLDSLFAGTLSGLVSAFLSPMLLFAFNFLRIPLHPQALGFVVVFPVMIGYFAYSESRYGRTIGKWLFGMRVVNDQSESPALINAIIRALLIPGITMTASQFAAYLLVDTTQFATWSDIVSMILKSQSASMFAWIVMIPLISTARRENGYRCVHGFLSGTKVVRLAGDLESRLLDRYGVTVPEKLDESKTLGDYELLGRFKTNDLGQSSYLAKDKKLNRPIWLFDGFDHDPIGENRSHLARPSRLRIIQHAQQDGRHWYATESVPGVPLVDLMDRSSCTWQSVCPLVRDVAYELMQSEENDLVPESFSPNHIWLDHTGRVRVLDHALVGNGSPDGSDSTIAAPKSIGMDTIESVLRQYMEKNDHPVHLMDLTAELEEQKEQPDKFRWLVNRFNDFIEQPSTWNPLDRVGMLAISFGIEYAVVMSTIFLASFLVMMWDLPTVSQSAIAFSAGCLIVAVMAYVFQGGPAIQLSGISVRRNKDKSQASRFRAAVRAVLGWCPWITLLSIFMYVIFHQQATDAEVTGNIQLTDSTIAIQVLTVAFSALAVFGIGLLLAIWNPRRGIQDFLAGTRLMRK